MGELYKSACVNHCRPQCLSIHYSQKQHDTKLTFQGLVPFQLPTYAGERLTNALQLDDPSLLHEESLLNGQWVQSQSGKRFDVEGKLRASMPRKQRRIISSYNALQTLALVRSGPLVPQTRSPTLTNMSSRHMLPSKATATPIPANEPRSFSSGMRSSQMHDRISPR
jgi:hypothetical protein